MAHYIGMIISVVEVSLQLRWLQICIGENSFTEHALKLSKSSVFQMQVKPKRTIVIILFPFLRHDEGLYCMVLRIMKCGIRSYIYYGYAQNTLEFS